jgi:hypothetical protein
MYDSDIDWVTEEVVGVVPVSFADICYENSDTNSASGGEEAPASKRRQRQDVMFDIDVDWRVEEDVEAMSGVEVVIVAESAIFRIRVLDVNVEYPALLYTH